LTEVVQQSKARQKGEFLREFSPYIAEGTQIAYKGASSDIQAKLRRVIDVWKDRNIFEPHVQEAVESRLEGELFRDVKGSPKLTESRAGQGTQLSQGRGFQRWCNLHFFDFFGSLGVKPLGQPAAEDFEKPSSHDQCGENGQLGV
jgi:hypothetical protein